MLFVGMFFGRMWTCFCLIKCVNDLLLSLHGTRDIKHNLVYWTSFSFDKLLHESKIWSNHLRISIKIQWSIDRQYKLWYWLIYYSHRTRFCLRKSDKERAVLNRSYLSACSNWISRCFSFSFSREIFSAFRRSSSANTSRNKIRPKQNCFYTEWFTQKRMKIDKSYVEVVLVWIFDLQFHQEFVHLQERCDKHNVQLLFYSILSTTKAILTPEYKINWFLSSRGLTFLIAKREHTSRQEYAFCGTSPPTKLIKYFTSHFR